MPPLCIVIVNYCSETDLIACLESLHIPDSPYHIYIVDNASPDGSGPRIQSQITARAWTPHVTFIPAPRNGGFAYGNNIGLKKAVADHPDSDLFLLLNPDTLVLPDSIPILVDFMNQNPKVGIAGARLEHEDGRSQWAARSFPSLLSELADVLPLPFASNPLRRWSVVSPDRETRRPTDWVVGAAMIIRRPVLDQIGFFDETYFLYFEEVDYCFMARRAGWPSWYVPESRVIHRVGRSTPVDQRAGRLPKYWFESQRYFYLKNFGWFKTLLITLLWTASYPFKRFRTVLAGRTPFDPPRFWLDFVSFNFFGYYRP